MPLRCWWSCLDDTASGHTSSVPRLAARRAKTGDDGEGRNMEITEVKVFPIQEEKLKAFVSIVFDHSFMVNAIKIIQGREGLFISMPSRKKKNGEFKDVAHPLNNETRRMIEDKVLGEYERILTDRGEKMPQIALSSLSTAAGDGEIRIPHQGMPIAAAPEKTLEEVEEMH